MVLSLEEVEYLQLVHKPEVLDLGTLSHSHIEIDVSAGVHLLIESVELILLHGTLKVGLVFKDLLLHVLGSANWSLGLLRVPFLVDPLRHTALGTEELVTLLAVVSEVLEIELGLALRVLTHLGLHGFEDQSLSLRLSGQLKRRITSGIDLVNINTSRQEALEDVDVSRGGSLVQ